MTTDYAAVGHRFGLSMAEASVALARLSVAILERQPWNMNAVRWSQAKADSRRRLQEAEMHLRAVRARG